MPTVCAECAELVMPFSGAPWYRWLCHAYKLEPEWNPVTGQYDRDPPYGLCKNINRPGIDCSAFVKGPNSFKPRANKDGEINAPAS